MKEFLTLKPWLARISIQPLACAMIAVFFLSGCGPETWKWQEEARLNDGRSIMVQREVIFGGARLPWEQNRQQSEWILRFNSPDNTQQKFEYRSVGGLNPGAVVFVKGIPYVIAIASRGDAIAYYDCPKPPYVIHRYENGKWKRTGLEDIPFTMKKMNLAFFSDSGFNNAQASGTASANQIVDWNDGLAQNRREPAWSDIVRPPGDKIESKCNQPGQGVPMDWDKRRKQFRESMPKNTE